jgi:hypothetical protein
MLVPSSRYFMLNVEAINAAICLDLVEIINP